MYAAVSSGVAKGDLLYLIFEHKRTREAIPLIDNRRKLTTEDEQMRICRSIKDLGGVMYGADEDLLTQRQKMELGDYFTNVKYVQCDKHDIDAESAEQCRAIKLAFPTWKFGENKYKGFRSRAQLNKIVQVEKAIAAQRK